MTARVYPAAILSGLLLWTAFYPLNLGLPALIALAPFLTLVRAENVGPWRRYAAAYLGGVVFFGLAIKWVRVAHPMMLMFTWPVGTLYCAAYWPLALLLLRRLDRLKFSFALTLPLVWVGLEYVRAHFPTGFVFLQPVGMYQLVGFGWYGLGYALHDYPPLVQAADLGGVYLISAAIACVNGAAYEWFARSALVRRHFLRWPPTTVRARTFVWEAYATAWAAIFPILVVCYGTVQLGHPPYARGPRIAAVQGNVPQNEKMERPDQPDGETPLERAYFPLTRAASRPSGATPAPDLVILPETCWPAEWYQLSDEFPANDPARVNFDLNVKVEQAEFRRKLAPFARPMLLGLNRVDLTGPKTFRKYNAAMLFEPNGEVKGTYDKMHLVPFGEYVPLADVSLFKKVLSYFTPYEGRDYSCTPGSTWTQFPITAAAAGVDKPEKEYRFGVLICYEDSDPYLARQYNWAAGHGLDADFLVNISNDGWFNGTEEHAQHLAICRLRAIESRRSIVRAVNTGISAIIDPDGRLVAMPDEKSWDKSHGVPAVVRGEVPIETRSTVYAQLGDWVPLLCWLLVAAGFVAGRRRKKKGEGPGTSVPGSAVSVRT